MNYKNYLKAIYQNFEDPTKYNEPPRYCKICDIQEEKTYFLENTLICQDCHEEEEEEKQNFINIINKIKKLKK